MITSAQKSVYEAGDLTACSVTSGGENELWWAIVLGAHHGILSVELSVRALTEGPHTVSVPGDESEKRRH